MVLTHTEKEQVVEEVWAKFKDVLLATGREELTVAGDGTDQFVRDVALTQSIRGIPVVRGGVKLRIDPHTGRILEFWRRLHSRSRSDASAETHCPASGRQAGGRLGRGDDC